MSDVEPKKLDWCWYRNCGSLEAALFIKIVKVIMARSGAPKFIHADKGFRNTSFAWGNFMEKQGIKTPVEGKKSTVNA